MSKTRGKLSRREFLRAAGLMGAGAAFAACQSPFKPATTESGPIQLVYQDSHAAWFQPMVQQMLDEFQAAHPNTRVFYTPEPDNPKDIAEKTLAMMQAGTAPDVFQGCCDWYPIWAQKGYALDLRPFLSDIDAATKAEWDPAQYKAFTMKDGAQYALPKFHGALALYYNKDLFDRYKVDYPTYSWNHDDYTQAMKRLSQDTNGDGKQDVWGSMSYVTWDRIQMHVNGWGGHLVDPENPARCAMGEPPAVAALEWLRARLWDDKVMATQLDAQNAWPNDFFAAGKLAMVEDGSWNLRNILSASNFRVGVAPFPAGPVRHVTLTTNDGFSIYSGTKHPEAAWELVKFLIGKDFGRAMAKAGFLQPARSSLLDDWMSYIRAELPDKAKDVDLAAFADGHLKGYSVTDEVAADMADATRIANAMWDRILALGQAPAESITQAALEIDRATQALNKQ